jgi:hypothetical protein
MSRSNAPPRHAVAWAVFRSSLPDNSAIPKGF